MSFDRFVVTLLAPEADYGFVRQLSATEGTPRWSPIGFKLSGVAEAIYTEDGSFHGVRIPHEAIRMHVPQIGDELCGVIAMKGLDEVALDELGNQFLRNWYYAQQEDVFGKVVFSDDVDAFFGPVDDTPDHRDYDDDDTIDAHSLAEIEHGRNLGMYNS